MVLSGSNKLLDTAMSASAYEKVLSILGDTGIIVPFADPIVSKLDSTTLTTVRRTASGVEVTGTWSSAPKNFTTVEPKYQGIIPIVHFGNGGDNISLADNDYFSPGNGTSDNPFSFGFWWKLDGTVSSGPLLEKSDGNNNAEYILRVASTIEPTFRLYDANVNNYIGRTVGGPAERLRSNAWNFVVCTYDGGGTAGGIDIYLNGTVQDNSNVTLGSYTAMHNTAQTLEFNPHGPVAGGPLGLFWTQKQLNTQELDRLYRLGRRLLELP